MFLCFCGEKSVSYFVTRCLYRGAAECLPRAAVTETNAGSSLRHELLFATADTLVFESKLAGDTRSL